MQGGRWCGGCERYRTAVGVRSCKRQRICKLIDVSLISRHPNKSLEQLDEIHKATNAGSSGAALYVSRLSELPCSWEDFRRHVLEIHRLIFRNADVAIAGRFREPGEQAHFGHASHERCGVDACEVERELRHLHGLMPPDPVALTREQLAHWAARFLERFFMIHPFIDGNGRTARFIVDWCARSTRAFRLKQDRVNSKLTRRYVQALQFAHRHEPRNHDSSHKFRVDPYKHLARIMYEQLDPLPPNWEDMVPPEG